MKEKIYNLDFIEALKIVLDGGSVRGQFFRDSIFMRLNSSGQLVIVNASNMYRESREIFIKQISKQKFRELTVMTVKELSF